MPGSPCSLLQAVVLSGDSQAFVDGAQLCPQFRHTAPHQQCRDRADHTTCGHGGRSPDQRGQCTAGEAAQRVHAEEGDREDAHDAPAHAVVDYGLYIGTEHILLGLIREGEGVAAQVLVKLGADLNRVRQQVIQLLSGYQGKEPATGPAEGTPSTSLVLDQFGRNLTQAAREGKLDPVIGHEKEIERVMQILSRRTKNNPVLIGEPGVGKTAVVEGLAQAIVKAMFQKPLKISSFTH